MQLALYQPDIPQNLGAFIRMAACLGLPLHIIEPCGFPLDDRRMRRAAMDYYDRAQIIRHAQWAEFLAAKKSRLILLTTRAAEPYTEIGYLPGDILLLGRESAGVPQEVHDAADLRVTIPMQSGCRSLNVALAAAMVAGEAVRQTAYPLLSKSIRGSTST